MDLTTNGVVIIDAIKFVQTNKEILTMSKEGRKKSDEQDYDEDRDHLEEQGQEDGTGAPGEQGKTTNQVF